MAKRDYYEVLGLKKGADAAAIKKSYRKLARQCHPDTCKGDKKKEQQFKELTEAYEVLSDEKKKKLYDQYGEQAVEANFDENILKQMNSYGGGGGFGGGWSRSWSANGGGGFEDLFGDFFGGGFGGADFGRGRHRAQDMPMQAELTVSFEEAALGCDKVIQTETSGKRLQIHIPAGIDEGQQIRIKDGDRPLHIMIHIEEHPFFERKGLDVYTTASIPFTTAVLGGKAIFKTLTGAVECNVPAGCQSGSKIRIKGKGITSMKDKNLRGDQYVTIQIKVPRTLTPAERQAVIDLREAQEGSTKTA